MKLLVVDDHSLIRGAVRHVMQALASSVTVLTAADCDEGFAIAEGESELEVLLLDFKLRGSPTGVQAIKAWRQRHPALPVVVLSSVEDQATVLAAMAAGAAGFIAKASSNELMVSALRLVLAGGSTCRPRCWRATAAGPRLRPSAPSRPTSPRCCARFVEDDSGTDDLARRHGAQPVRVHRLEAMAAAGRRECGHLAHRPDRQG